MALQAGPWAAAPGLPTITFDQQYTLRRGGIEAELMHFGSARTNGDTVVCFTNLKVLAVGDLFSPNAPEPDHTNGGSIIGWGSLLAQVLRLDADVVVPSSGPMVKKTGLEAYQGQDRYARLARTHPGQARGSQGSAHGSIEDGRSWLAVELGRRSAQSLLRRIDASRVRSDEKRFTPRLTPATCRTTHHSAYHHAPR